MSARPNMDASGTSVLPRAAEIFVGQALLSSSSAYSIKQFIGEGCYGKVARCLNRRTNKEVAVKILKADPDSGQDAEHEVSILKVISVLNPDQCNVVRFFETFQHLGHKCLVFEMLEMDLYKLIHEVGYKPMFLCAIQAIAKQLLVALDALKSLGVVHTDIKPDNVMFVNGHEIRIKLIDFGLAALASQVQPGWTVQPVGYRAPEVSLGLPFTEAIDMWGVGCVLVFLYVADNFFPVTCEYQMMRRIVELLGQPEDRLLFAGQYTEKFFMQEEAAEGKTWRLMTEEEYSFVNNTEVQQGWSFFVPPNSLDGLVNMYPKEEEEHVDRLAFVDLVKRLLDLDGDQRISPSDALQQPFITRSHLSNQSDSREGEPDSGLDVTVTHLGSRADAEELTDPSNKLLKRFQGFSKGIKYSVFCCWSPVVDQ